MRISPAPTASASVSSVLAGGFGTDQAEFGTRCGLLPRFCVHSGALPASAAPIRRVTRSDAVAGRAGRRSTHCWPPSSGRSRSAHRCSDPGQRSGRRSCVGLRLRPLVRPRLSTLSSGGDTGGHGQTPTHVLPTGLRVRGSLRALRPLPGGDAGRRREAMPPPRPESSSPRAGASPCLWPIGMANLATRRTCGPHSRQAWRSTTSLRRPTTRPPRHSRTWPPLGGP